MQTRLEWNGAPEMLDTSSHEMSFSLFHESLITSLDLSSNIDVPRLSFTASTIAEGAKLFLAHIRNTISYSNRHAANIEDIIDPFLEFKVFVSFYLKEIYSSNLHFRGESVGNGVRTQVLIEAVRLILNEERLDALAFDMHAYQLQIPSHQARSTPTSVKEKAFLVGLVHAICLLYKIYPSQFDLITWYQYMTGLDGAQIPERLIKLLCPKVHDAILKTIRCCPRPSQEASRQAIFRNYKGEEFSDGDYSSVTSFYIEVMNVKVCFDIGFLCAFFNITLSQSSSIHKRTMRKTRRLSSFKQLLGKRLAVCLKLWLFAMVFN